MDKVKCLVNMIIAYLIYPFNKGKFKNRNIWLVGGNAGELFVDNGRAMYEYLRSKQQEEVYWVINKNAKIAKKNSRRKTDKRKCKELPLFYECKSCIIFPFNFCRYCPVPFCSTVNKQISQKNI